MSAKVAIIGGGITGLTAAHALLTRGVQVSVFEAQLKVGGLNATYDFGSFTWDRFYHCILQSDVCLIKLLHDLGLDDQIRWRKTGVGLFANGRLNPMSTSWDLLRLPGLSLWAKLRFGLGILYAARYCSGEGLDAEPLTGWMLRVFGERVTEELWDPLLRCKLGEMRSRASAAFLWSTIRRLYSTRGKGLKKEEQLGYVSGGIRTILDRLCLRINDLGGEIHECTYVDQVASTERGVSVTTSGESHEFDACLLTTPAPVILGAVPQLGKQYREKLQSPQYMGMVCAVLVLDESLSSHYLINVTQDVPFTGVVEMTNLIDQSETDGHTLVYLPKYTSPADPLFEMSDHSVRELFLSALYQMFPGLDSSHVKSVHVFRERYVQPVPTLNYRLHAPTIETGIPNIYVANTAQIINDTLNNNAMVGIANKAVEFMMRRLELRSKYQSDKNPLLGAPGILTCQGTR